MAKKAAPKAAEPKAAPASQPRRRRAKSATKAEIFAQTGGEDRPDEEADPDGLRRPARADRARSWARRAPGCSWCPACSSSRSCASRRPRPAAAQPVHQAADDDQGQARPQRRQGPAAQGASRSSSEPGRAGRRPPRLHPEPRPAGPSARVSADRRRSVPPSPRRHHSTTQLPVEAGGPAVDDQGHALRRSASGSSLAGPIRSPVLSRAIGLDRPLAPPGDLGRDRLLEERRPARVGDLALPRSTQRKPVGSTRAIAVTSSRLAVGDRLGADRAWPTSTANGLSVATLQARATRPARRRASRRRPGCTGCRSTSRPRAGSQPGTARPLRRARCRMPARPLRARPAGRGAGARRRAARGRRPAGCR